MSSNNTPTSRLPRPVLPPPAQQQDAAQQQAPAQQQDAAGSSIRVVDLEPAPAGPQTTQTTQTTQTSDWPWWKLLKRGFAIVVGLFVLIILVMFMVSNAPSMWRGVNKVTAVVANDSEAQRRDGIREEIRTSYGTATAIRESENLPKVRWRKPPGAKYEFPFNSVTGKLICPKLDSDEKPPLDFGKGFEAIQVIDPNDGGETLSGVIQSRVVWARRPVKAEQEVVVEPPSAKK